MSAAADKDPTEPAPGTVPDASEGLHLILYVAGQTPKSRAAIANLHRICEEHLGGTCSVEVVDVSRDPARAVADQILALPTLVRHLPPPLKRIIRHARRQREGAQGTADPAEGRGMTTEGGSEGGNDRYVLRLFVTGTTPRSTLAIENLRRICETQLEGRYSLEVVDVYRDPQAARADQVVAAPTLVRRLPLPVRRLIGDLSDRERVLRGLDLQPVPGARESGQ